MDKYAGPPADEGVVSIPEALADPNGVFKGAPNIGVIAGPSYSPFYKQALSQSKGVSNSTGSEGPDQPEL